MHLLCVYTHAQWKVWEQCGRRVWFPLQFAAIVKWDNRWQVKNALCELGFSSTLFMLQIMNVWSYYWIESSKTCCGKVTTLLYSIEVTPLRPFLVHPDKWSVCMQNVSALLPCLGLWGILVGANLHPRTTLVEVPVAAVLERNPYPSFLSSPSPPPSLHLPSPISPPPILGPSYKRAQWTSVRGVQM